MRAIHIREGRRTISEPARAEGLRVARALREVIENAGYSVRSVEERLDWGQGSLTKVLNGVTPLRFSDAAAVCEVLGVDPRGFYMELAGSGGGGGRIPKKDKPGAPRSKRGVDPELRRVIQQEIRDHLAALKKSGRTVVKKEGDEDEGRD